MHEMSIAMNIVDLVSTTAQAEQAVSIQSIELEIGTMSGIMLEALEFCFEAAAKGTLAEGALLDILSIQAKGTCPVCNHISEVSGPADQCPNCGEFLLEITEGKDIKLRAIIIHEGE
jgi:hydrogenase nickel incorporation protein HypA/HybF